VEEMRDDHALSSAHPFLEEVMMNARTWRTAFLEAARRAGAETFCPALQDEAQLWANCKRCYGPGIGIYRAEVVRLFREWFLDSERVVLHGALEERIGAAWQSEVVDRLRALCQHAVKKQAT
jgi:hypothetical protein